MNRTDHHLSPIASQRGSKGLPRRSKSSILEAFGSLFGDFGVVRARCENVHPSLAKSSTTFFSSTPSNINEEFSNITSPSNHPIVKVPEFSLANFIKKIRRELVSLLIRNKKFDSLKPK